MTVALAHARIRLVNAPLLLAALACAVTAAVLLPPVYLVVRAVGEDSGVWSSLSADSTVQALARTVLLTVAVTATCAVIAVPLAWLTTRTDLPMRSAWAIVLALPLAIPSFVGGYTMISALGPGGMLHGALDRVGINHFPSIYGFRGSWFILSILSYPYILLPVRAALKRGDSAQEEASRSLGKGALETFRRVNIPQLRPAISAGALLVSLYVLSEFGAVSLLRYDTLTPLAYVQYTTRFDRGAAAVLGLPLIALAVLIVVVDSATRGRARYYARGQRRPPPTIKLGRWRWAAFLACALVAALGLGLPVSVIIYWLVKGISEAGATDFLAESAYNSARAAGFAAGIAALAALPLAALSARHAGWATGLLEKASYAGQALPAITIALSLVFFASHYASAVYQTLALLIFAYAIRIGPEAFGAIRSAMLQASPHAEEAARGLGAGPLRTFLRITAPQVFPGMSAGMALVFLTAIKELPMTLLLSPIGFDTLATQIWASTSEAFFARAALPALILVTLSAGAVALQALHEDWL